MIARLPRIPVNFASAVRAALLAAAGFELFKLVGTIYLRSVLRSPAGATFGPVLGLMVFAYVTARLLLFATAWAATSTPDLLPRTSKEAPSEEAPPEPAPEQAPQPVVILPRAAPVDGLKARQALAAAAVGGLAALGLSRLVRRDTDEMISSLPSGLRCSRRHRRSAAP